MSKVIVCDICGESEARVTMDRSIKMRVGLCKWEQADICICCIAKIRNARRDGKESKV